jgi:hypothetical protein
MAGAISLPSLLTTVGGFVFDMLSQQNAQDERDKATQRAMLAEQGQMKKQREAALSTTGKAFTPQAQAAATNKFTAANEADITKFVNDTTNPLGASTPGQGGRVSGVYGDYAGKVGANSAAESQGLNSALARMLAPGDVATRVVGPALAENSTESLMNDANTRTEINAANLDYMNAKPDPVLSMLGQGLGAAGAFFDSSPTKTSTTAKRKPVTNFHTKASLP